MKIAITGGGGFLGAHTMQHALAKGHDAWRFDRTDGNDVLGDLSQLNGAEWVIHMAGALGTSELFDTAEEAVAANVIGTLRILEWCEKHDAGFTGITMPDSNWANVYQATKLCAFRLATAWNQHRGVPVSHVRAFNAYGEGQKFGPGHPQKFLPTFSHYAWRGEPIPIWGNGEQTVDAVDARDVGRMLVDATMFGNNEVFDAGTGTTVSVLAIAGFVNNVTNNEAGVVFLPMRDGETPDTKIVARGEGWQQLGWKPELNWTRIDEVVRSYKPAVPAMSTPWPTTT